jgi:hypothetical protein
MRFFSLSTIILLLISGCSYINKNGVFKSDIHKSSPIVSSPPAIIIEDTQIIQEEENKELKEVMRKFDYILFSKLNSEIEDGEEDMFYGKNTQNLLKEFIEDCHKIESLYPDADNNYFILSKALKRQVTKLYKIVKIKKTEWIKPQIENIINVCNTCHNRFKN